MTPKPKPPTEAPRPLEDDCEDTIIAAATRGGWLCHAERKSRSKKGWRTAIKGHRGFPDLILISPDHRTIIVAELKRKPNKVEPHQWVWLDAFSDFAKAHAIEGGEIEGRYFPGLISCVWWTSETDAICQALANGRVPVLAGDA